MSALSQQRTPMIVYIDAPGRFYDSIIIAGAIQNMVGAAVVFSMRPLSSRTPVIDHVAANAQVTDTQGNNVFYDWNLAGVSEGDYFGWWSFTLPGLAQADTPEFPILITDHGPGAGTRTGAIVDGVVRYMPVTFSALMNDDRYGDLRLQQQAEVIKYRVLGQSIDPDQEGTLHPVLLDWLSKRLALDLTKAGIDYWSRQMRTVTTTQTSEVSSYPDIIASLEKLRAMLIPELAAEWRDLQILVPGLPQRKVMALPASSIGDPDDNPTMTITTANPQATRRLQTGGYGWSLAFGEWPFP